MKTGIAGRGETDQQHLLLVDQWIPRGPHVEKKNFDAEKKKLDADKKKLDEEKRMHYVVKKQSDALGTRPLK